MRTVYTIGFQGKPPERFITLLRGAGVDAVIDARLRNTSQLAGYTKRDDLAFLLREGFGIAYRHLPELAPAAEVLDSAHAGGAWDDFDAGFLPLLAERHAEDVGRGADPRHQAPCFSRVEAQAERCHRRLVAECWIAPIPDPSVVHP